MPAVSGWTWRLLLVVSGFAQPAMITKFHCVAVGSRLNRGKQSRLCCRPLSWAAVPIDKGPGRLSAAAIVTDEIEAEPKDNCVSPDSTSSRNLPGQAAAAYHAIADRRRKRPRRKATGCCRHRPRAVERSQTGLRSGPH